MSDEAAQNAPDPQELSAAQEPSAAEAAPRQRRKPGPRPGTEAAKRGGSAARDKYGSEFYSKIGSKGGSTVRERHGTGFYTEIGRRGGETTKRNLGTEHYSRIGRIGGKRAHGRHVEPTEPTEAPSTAPEQPGDQPTPTA